MPHKTAFRDALKIITANLPGWSLDVHTNNARISFYGRQEENQIAGVIFEDRSLVGRIRLDIAFPLWYLIEELGRPYCVRAEHLPALDASIIVIYWHTADVSVMGIITLESSEKWYPGALTETLLTATSNECTLPGALPWMGFARLWSYQRDYVD